MPSLFLFVPVQYPTRCESPSNGLDHMEDSGVIEKIDHSEWAAPKVVVPKRDGTVHLWGLQSHSKPVPRGGHIPFAPAGRFDGQSHGEVRRFQNWIYLRPTNRCHWHKKRGNMSPSTHIAGYTVSQDCHLGWPQHWPFFIKLWTWCCRDCQMSSVIWTTSLSQGHRPGAFAESEDYPYAFAAKWPPTSSV